MNQGITEALKRCISDATPQEILERYAGLTRAAAQADYGKFDNNVVVVDTETTGLSLENDELTQIAAAKIQGGKIVAWYVTFVNPGIFISPEISRLTRITDADVINAPTPEEALTALNEFVGDAVLVAHNAAFDCSFITEKHPQAAGLKNNLWVDSLDLARISLPRLRSHRLKDLVEAFGTTSSSHRADDDVAATCEVLRILLAATDAMPTELLCTIARLATPSDWPTGEVYRYFACRHLGVESLPEDIHVSLRAMREVRLKAVTGFSAQKFDPRAEDEQGNVRIIDFPDTAEIRDAFREKGLVGKLYDHYESRPEQAEMAQAVGHAFAVGKNLVVEAGTGVGKSMAYLVPAAMLAKRGKVTVGIATKTNQLLDQLLYHELPALSRAFAENGGLNYVSVKGYTNYPCLRRIENLVRAAEASGKGMPAMSWYQKRVSPAPTMAGILTFIEQTAYDDLENLRTGNFGLLRRETTCSSAECMKRKCPFYRKGCFVQGVRRLAENADIVVTNHALLFCDINADGALLPTMRYWVVDEAHGVEEAAREAFTVAVSAEGLHRLCSKVSCEDATANVFVKTRRTVEALFGVQSGFSPEMLNTVGAKAGYGEATRQAFSELIDAADKEGAEFAEAAAQYAASMHELDYFETPGGRAAQTGGGAYGADPARVIWLSADMRDTQRFSAVAAAGQTCAQRALALAQTTQRLVAFLDPIEGADAVQNDLSALTFALREVAESANVLCGPTDPAYVYAATVGKKAESLQESLTAVVYDVGASLVESFYSTADAVVYASATATINNSFDRFTASLGVQYGEHAATTLQLASSFDFDRNMTVYIPTDLPEPTEKDYLPLLCDLLVRAHIALGGSMLTLFTSRSDMMRCYDEVCEPLAARGLTLLCQRTGSSAKGLRDEFMANEKVSLFALKKFWQGFDAPGSTLRGVVVTKLPFVVPSEPLSREREARENREAWVKYSLSAAVIEVKQAVGRLIRTATDRGIVIITDKRLLTKSYGATFINSLPTKTVKKMTCAQIADDIRRNFGQMQY